VSGTTGQALLGVLALPAIAWLLSENRGQIRWRLVLAAAALHWAVALVMLHVPPIAALLGGVTRVVAGLQRATADGTAFVFGYLGGGPLPFATETPAAAFVLALQALPLLLVISALSALLFHLGVLQRVIGGFAFVLRWLLGIGGPVGVAAAANVFVGMVEAPLLIRPYLARLDRGELFMVMTCGMATIAGTVFVLYAALLAPVVADAGGQLLVASLMNAPAAILIAALMVPPAAGAPGAPVVPADDAAAAPPARAGRSVGGMMEAVADGTAQGVPLLLGVAAMLIVLVALVSLANQVLGLLPDVGGAALTLERLFGWPLTIVAWLIGVPWAEAALAGHLLAVKVVLNELVAYRSLAALPADALTSHSRLVLVYAMCGFANFGSLGIMIGGLGAMVPDRRREVIDLGLRSIVAGLLASCLSAAVAGLLL
jgi:CNT family concentrative nucleoside transporter